MDSHPLRCQSLSPKPLISCVVVCIIRIAIIALAANYPPPSDCNYPQCTWERKIAGRKGGRHACKGRDGAIQKYEIHEPRTVIKFLILTNGEPLKSCGMRRSQNPESKSLTVPPLPSVCKVNCSCNSDLIAAATAVVLQ